MGTTLYQAIGKAKEAGLFLVAREVILYVPMLLILPIFYSVKGIYLAGVPVNIIVFIGVIVMVTMEFRRWKKNAPKAI
jgi:Na+-driven multidrug efflux pump